jgi:hypothetical protein
MRWRVEAMKPSPSVPAFPCQATRNSTAIRSHRDALNARAKGSMCALS